MASIFQVLLLLTISSIFLSQTEGCSCIHRSLQDKYCDAGYVIRVKINSKAFIRLSRFNGRVKYGISIIKKYRALTGYGSADKNTLWTASNSAACGVPWLVVGQTYLIAGSVINGELRINLCQWYPTWKSLTNFQKKAVKKIWKKQCGKCKIKLCNGCWDLTGGVLIAFPAPTDICTLDKDNVKWKCYEKYAVCRLRKGICSFKGSEDLTKCRKAVIIPPGDIVISSGN